MQIEADVSVSLFVRDEVTGRLVFNPRAIEALGLSPAELARRGYLLEGDGIKDQRSSDVEAGSRASVSEAPE